MNDYDDIRTCCQGKKLCNSCWKFMEAAYKILRELLYDIFGFEKILWVFSGRRGMHAWVCDEEARNLQSIHRKSITSFLNVCVNNEKSDRLVIPESLQKMNTDKIFLLCWEILKEYESFLFEEQNFLGHAQNGDKNYKKLLSVLKRHYKDNGLMYNEEVYINLQTVNRGASLKLYHKLLKTYADDIMRQNPNLNSGKSTNFIYNFR